MSPLAPRLALKATVLYIFLLAFFRPPLFLFVAGSIFGRRLADVAFLAPSPFAATLSSAPTPLPPFRRLPAHPRCADRHRRLLFLLRRWRSVCDGLARAFQARASLAALPRLSLSRPPTPSQGQGFVLLWAAPLLCFGVAPVSSLCRGYYSYSRLLSDSVFEGVGVRLLGLVPQAGEQKHEA